MKKENARVFLSALVIILAGFVVAQSSPLSSEQIEMLIKLNAPDMAISKEISQRGLSFVPNRRTVDDLRQLGAGPLTLDAIKRLIPFLEEAKKMLPEVVTRIYRALNEGNLQSVASWLSARLLASSTELNRICRPSAYRAHYIVSFSEGASPRGIRSVDVMIRVLTSPLNEHGQVMRFREQEEGFVLQAIQSSTTFILKDYEDTAKQMARNFYSALKSNDQSKLSGLVSSPTILAINDPKFINLTRSLKDLKSEPFARIISYKGLKAFIELYTSGDKYRSDKWEFHIDRIGNELKIVKWKVTTNTMGMNYVSWGNEDPNIERYILARFGL